MRVRLASLFVLAAVAAPLCAQPSNREAFERLALACLQEAPGALERFRLSAPARMPYVRTALVQRWLDEGRAVFTADSTLTPEGSAPPERLPRVRYTIEEVALAYERAGRRHVRRTATLGLRYVRVGADGQLAADRACRDSFTDVVPAQALDALESPAFPETQAAAPEAPWRRRYLEPAVLAATTALGVYLFFTLRSRGDADSG